MRCEEFRLEVHSLLDAGRPDDLPPDCAAHVAGCPPCARFAAAMRGVDRAQREQPRIPIPASLLADLLSIPLREMRKEFSLGRYVRKAAALILPGVGLILLGMAFLPPGPFFWLRFTVLTAGFTLFSVHALRRRRLAAPPEEAMLW